MTVVSYKRRADDGVALLAITLIASQANILPFVAVHSIGERKDQTMTLAKTKRSRARVAFLAFVAAGALGCSRFRKLRVRPRGSAPVET